MAARVFGSVVPSMKISAIVPTIGRPDSLRALLTSLVSQTHEIDEVIVADASPDNSTQNVTSDPVFESVLIVNRVTVDAANAVRQRAAAIEIARGEYFL